LIVVDVNVVVHLLTNGPRHALARDLWAKASPWRLPPLWRHEFLNVLATLTREGYIEPGEAELAWRNGLDLLSPCEVETEWVESFKLAVARKISAYDAQYVTLATHLDTILVTEDSRLRRKFPDTCRSMEDTLKRL
jgi:predicted nucleic acid-binding protein